MPTMVGHKGTPDPPSEMCYRSSENFSQPGADQLDLTYGDFRPQDDLDLLLSNDEFGIVASPTQLNSAEEQEANPAENGAILSSWVQSPIWSDDDADFSLALHLGYPEIQTDEVRSCFCFNPHVTWTDQCFFSLREPVNNSYVLGWTLPHNSIAQDLPGHHSVYCWQCCEGGADNARKGCGGRLSRPSFPVPLLSCVDGNAFWMVTTPEILLEVLADVVDPGVRVRGVFRIRVETRRTPNYVSKISSCALSCQHDRYRWTPIHTSFWPFPFHRRC